MGLDDFDIFIIIMVALLVFCLVLPAIIEMIFTIRVNKKNKFYDKKVSKFFYKTELTKPPLFVEIAPRGYGKLKFVLETVEKLYSEAYQDKPASTNMCFKREGKIEAYREVLNLLRAVINE